MNRKQVIILVIAGVALGGIGLYLSQQRSASFDSKEKTASKRLLGDFPVNDVSRVVVRQRSNEVNLVMAEGWTVRERDGYPANPEEVIGFVRKLWNLRPAQSQKIGPSQLGRLDLLPPDSAATNTGTLIELLDKDGKAIRTLLFGKESIRESGGGDPMGGGGWPNGRWLCLPDKPGSVYLVSEAFSEIDPKPERWLKRDFFRVEKARSITVDFPIATNSWKLTREMETSEWKLADAKAGEQLDASKAANVAYPLGAPSFTDVQPGAKIEPDGTNGPTVVKVETFDNFDYTVRLGSKTNEHYLLTVAVAARLAKERTPGEDEKPEDKARLDKEFKDKLQKLEDKLKQEQSLGKWTYLVSNWSVEPLLKERSQLLAQKQEPLTPDAQPSTNAMDRAEQPALEIPPFPPAGTNAGGL